MHIVTVNDYLARRDRNGTELYLNGLALQLIALINTNPTAMIAGKLMQCDIIYGTNNEFGFDYLRDNMVHTPDEMVQAQTSFCDGG